MWDDKNTIAIKFNSVLSRAGGGMAPMKPGNPGYVTEGANCRRNFLGDKMMAINLFLTLGRVFCCL
jgi:hypothetical protein